MLMNQKMMIVKETYEDKKISKKININKIDKKNNIR